MSVTINLHVIVQNTSIAINTAVKTSDLALNLVVFHIFLLDPSQATRSLNLTNLTYTDLIKFYLILPTEICPGSNKNNLTLTVNVCFNFSKGYLLVHNGTLVNIQIE
jgi:hypothetical protein